MSRYKRASNHKLQITNHKSQITNQKSKSEGKLRDKNAIHADYYRNILRAELPVKEETI